MNGTTAGEDKEVQKVAVTNLDEQINESNDKSIEKSKVFTSSSSLSNSKVPLFHVSSSENLKTVGADISKNEFIKPDEAMAWLIKPIDISKFFK